MVLTPRLISTSMGEAHSDVIPQRPSQQQELFLPALKSARVGALRYVIRMWMCDDLTCHTVFYCDALTRREMKRHSPQHTR